MPMKWRCLALKLKAFVSSETSITCYRTTHRVSEGLNLWTFFIVLTEVLRHSVYYWKTWCVGDGQCDHIYGGRFSETSEECSDKSRYYNAPSLALGTSGGGKWNALFLYEVLRRKHFACLCLWRLWRSRQVIYCLILHGRCGASGFFCSS